MSSSLSNTGKGNGHGLRKKLSKRIIHVSPDLPLKSQGTILTSTSPIPQEMTLGDSLLVLKRDTGLETVSER